MKKLLLILILTSFFNNVNAQNPTIEFFSETCTNFTLKIVKPGYNGNAVLNFGQTPVGFNPAIGTFAAPNVNVNFVGGVGYVTGTRTYTSDDTLTIFYIEKFNATTYSGLSRPEGYYYDKSIAMFISPVLSVNNSCGYEFRAKFSNGRGLYQNSYLADPTTYTFYCQLSGANTGNFTLLNQPLNIGGDISFQIPPALITNPGLTTLTITQIVRNPSATCYENIIFPNYSTNFTVSGSLGSPASINVSEPLCQGYNGTVTFNTTFYPDGVYTMFYTLTGSNNGSFTLSNVTISSGVATFTIPLVQIPNVGNTNIDIDGIFNGDFSVWCTYPDGTISDNFLINSFPNVTGTNSVAVTEPLCLGSNGVATFNSSSLQNGSYDITYTLSGANASTQTASGVVVASGTGTFTIPSSALTNAGTTTISLSSVVASASGCTTTITPGTITDSFVVNELPNISGINILSPIDICINGNGSVTFSSTLLANGTYNINYTLSGANTGNYIASNVSFNSGSCTFSIPSSYLTNIGSTTITLNNISNTTNNCQSNF